MPPSQAQVVGDQALAPHRQLAGLGRRAQRQSPQPPPQRVPASAGHGGGELSPGPENTSIRFDALPRISPAPGASKVYPQQRQDVPHQTPRSSPFREPRAERGAARPPPTASAGEAEIQAALERDLHLTADQVKDQRGWRWRSSATARCGRRWARPTPSTTPTAASSSPWCPTQRRSPRPEPSGPRSSWSSTARAALDVKLALDARSGTPAGSAPGRGPGQAARGRNDQLVLDTASNSVRVTVGEGHRRLRSRSTAMV